MGGHADMGTSVISAQAAKQQITITRLYFALKKITRYQSPAYLRRNSRRDWGCEYEEALEYAYENIQQTAKDAIKGMREPR
jgi:hypothetical protein